MKENRFYLARTKNNKHGFQSAKEVHDNTGISRSMIDDLESEEKERNVSYKTVARLAEYYGVSSDYLLKLSDIPSVTPEMKAAAEYTGLSEVCIEKIRKINALSPRLITALSFLLEDYGFYRIVLEDVSWFIRNSSLANNNGEDDDFVDILSKEELDLLGKLVDEHHIQLVGPERAARSCAKEAGTGLEHLLSRKIRPTEKLVQYWQEDDNQWIFLQEKINEDRRESKEE